MSVQASCDYCSHVFKVDKVSMRNISKDVKAFYITCPECSCEYKTHYINKEIEQQQAVVKRRRAALNTPTLTDEQLKEKNRVLGIEINKLEKLLYELAIEIEGQPKI